MAAHTYDDIASHLGHAIVCVSYGATPHVEAAIECEDCNVVLLSYESPDFWGKDDEELPASLFETWLQFAISQIDELREEETRAAQRTVSPHYCASHNWAFEAFLDKAKDNIYEDYPWRLVLEDFAQRQPNWPFVGKQADVETALIMALKRAFETQTGLLVTLDAYDPERAVVQAPLFTAAIKLRSAGSGLLRALRSLPQHQNPDLEIQEAIAAYAAADEHLLDVLYALQKSISAPASGDSSA